MTLLWPSMSLTNLNNATASVTIHSLSLTSMAIATNESWWVSNRLDLCPAQDRIRIFSLFRVITHFARISGPRRLFMAGMCLLWPSFILLLAPLAATVATAWPWLFGQTTQLWWRRRAGNIRGLIDVGRAFLARFWKGWRRFFDNDRGWLLYGHRRGPQRPQGHARVSNTWLPIETQVSILKKGNCTVGYFNNT